MTKKFSKDIEQRAKEVVSGLPELPKDLSRKELIASMEMEIHDALQRGYTFEQIQQAVMGVGFDISVPTMKEYYRAAQSKKKKKAGRKKTGRKKAGGEPSAAFEPSGAVIGRADADEKYSVADKQF